jgi:hypothetical protein
MDTKTKQDDKEQSARFIEAAKSVGADKSGKLFNKVLDRVVPKKSPKKIA